MRSIVLATAFTLGTGCAAAVPAESTLPDPAAETAAAEEQRESDRVRELRARLALAEARAAEVENRGQPLPSRDTVRIGDEPTPEEGLAFFDGEGEGWDQPEARLPEPEPEPEPEQERGPRPVLRLYGLPQLPSESLPMAGVDPYANGFRAVGTTPPAPTPSVAPSNEHLPWESVAPATNTMASALPVAAPQRIDLGLDTYRSALGLLQSRSFGQSLAEFERFIQTHPNHPQIANARYWRGEVLYIQRQYGRARVAFQGYLRQHADGAKIADALLKLALCSRRLGDESEAASHFERLRREFPSSDAARLASREVGR